MAYGLEVYKSDGSGKTILDMGVYCERVLWAGVFQHNEPFNGGFRYFLPGFDPAIHTAFAMGFNLYAFKATYYVGYVLFIRRAGYTSETPYWEGSPVFIKYVKTSL